MTVGTLERPAKPVKIWKHQIGNPVRYYHWWQLSERSMGCLWAIFATSYESISLSCIGEGNGNPLQCSCLENTRNGRAWWAAIYGVRHL